MEFRRLKGAELEKILQINVDFRSGFADRGAARRFLETEHCWLYAALREDAVIGFAYGYELSSLDGKADMLYIHEVGVAEPEQRRDRESAAYFSLQTGITRQQTRCTGSSAARWGGIPAVTIRFISSRRMTLQRALNGKNGNNLNFSLIIQGIV